tara:strand:- start:1374 stop:1685 length:312 start_codon:yes stop_codon:yes gene_type:complete
MSVFFFSTRKQFITKYSSLFDSQKQAGEEDDDGQDQGNTYSSHWGWFATVYQLSKTSILTITGDKSITDLNFAFVLNYLSIEKDYNAEVARAQKQSQQKYNMR